MKSKKPIRAVAKQSSFHLEFLNASQKLAWATYQQNDILFMLGPAGVGKSWLATSFACHDIINNEKEKVYLTRPTVSAEEDIGFLPGDINEKVNPYMIPLYDSIKLLTFGTQREKVQASIEVAPLAFCRGRTFRNGVCILDEAQNCTKTQLKLYLTRLGENSKMIITADPDQSDIHNPAISDVVNRLSSINRIGVIFFKENSIVRNPLISQILDKF